MIAAGQSGTGPLVRLLLDKGAQVDAASSSLFGTTTALTDAAYSARQDDVSDTFAAIATQARQLARAMSFDQDTQEEGRC